MNLHNGNLRTYTTNDTEIGSWQSVQILLRTKAKETNYITSRTLKQYTIYIFRTSPVATNWIVAAFLRWLPETESATLCKVLLVILFSSVKLLGRQYLTHYLPVQKLLLPVPRFQCCFLLFRCVEVNPRSVLSSYVVPLNFYTIM